MWWLASRSNCMASEKLGELPGHCHQWWSFPNNCQGGDGGLQGISVWNAHHEPLTVQQSSQVTDVWCLNLSICLRNERGYRNTTWLVLKIFEDHVNQHQKPSRTMRDTKETKTLRPFHSFSGYKRFRTLLTYYVYFGISLPYVIREILLAPYVMWYSIATLIVYSIWCILVYACIDIYMHVWTLPKTNEVWQDATCLGNEPSKPIRSPRFKGHGLCQEDVDLYQ